MKAITRWIALLAGVALAAPAAAESEPHDHAGALFHIRLAPHGAGEFVYRVFRPDPGTLAGLIVERGRGYSGDTERVDLTLADCPALGPAVAAIGVMPLPVVRLNAAPDYDYEQRGAVYYFAGFARFPNGAAGEVTFHSYDIPGRPTDPQLDAMRALVRAFDGCRPRGG